MSKSPRFEADYYTSIDISMSEKEMAEHGWVYVGESVGNGYLRTTDEGVYGIVRLWHDRNHIGPWVFCDAEPCNEIVKVDI